MATPIAPTPILFGEDAERLDRYMEESNTQKDKFESIPFDKAKFAAAFAKMMSRRMEAKRARANAQ